jgi:hypothetical protein
MIASPADSLARLGEQFSRDELTAAGVAVLDAEGRLAPAPALRGEGAEIIALREYADDEPYGLLTARGCLHGESVIEMLADYRWRRRAGESSGYVYLAFSWDDFLWLEETGQAALYCPVADQLTVSLVRQLTVELRTIGESAAACGAAAAPVAPAGAAGERIGDEPANAAGPASAVAHAPAQDRPACVEAPGSTAAPSADEPPASAARPDSASDPALAGLGLPPGVSLFSLVIVAWSPATHSAAEPPGLVARLAELAEWERVASDAYAETDVIVWRPDAEELRGLDLIGRHGDCETLGCALERSVESSGRTLAALVASPSPQNFLEARAAYRRALTGSGQKNADLSELQADLAAYEHQLQCQFVVPLLQRAAESLDPRERARCAVAAETCDLFHRLAPIVGVQLSELASRGSPLTPELFRGGGLQTVVTLAKTLAAVVGRRD